ncbi:MAG: acyl-CoA dehydrogenase family protein [Hyphomicrobiaceae bacterium]
MPPLKPRAGLPTHEVVNTPPHMGGQDLWSGDTALREGVAREGATWTRERMETFGRLSGSAETLEKANDANRHAPELKAFDRYGMRINEVAFHPAYHDLMSLAFANEIPNFAWRHRRPGAQVAHMALSYMLNQAEGGVMCPMAMTYAAIPVLVGAKGTPAGFVDKTLSNAYDLRDIPWTDKSGATVGMFMTEKQGGSDVRANTTRALAETTTSGPGASYRLTGHKFFCSAPMSDAFLALAYTDAGLSCFFIPRWTPDGERNAFYIQRLKDKLGNRSNASAEIEFDGTHAVMIGEEGRGVRTIIDMVQGTRIYCAVGSASLMRQAVVQALHHTAHRSAFQKRLIDQPLMKNVLADLALESEAALVLWLRLARALDEAPHDESAAALARIGTATAKYWICKRAPAHVFEAMECHGGPGYVEDSILPRLYREAPVNSIWEGSGNIMCLDVLRAMSREPDALEALLAECEAARGGNATLDHALIRLKGDIASNSSIESRARRITEAMAVCWQAALLVRHAPSYVADAFCASRLGEHWTGAYGTLPSGADLDAIIARARPN